ncbi:cytochrome c oxidase assembly factor 7 homolog [Artemia franciscana]|uniref:Cytochrome c oxidase assembly factor 7 n=1 Tax=Artemia franciscana TaxID=6661 RepID=A0AA88I8Z7_ARTSF|nr:hypothetical protein QYM36_002955 [Artemia franciscana]
MSLKREEEVKEYIQNLGTEYRFGCFHEKKPEVCQLLGEYFEAVTKDLEKAAKVFKSNCDDNKFPRSCFKYGGFAFIGQGCKEDKDAAYDYFKKGCDLGNAPSCLNLGLLNVTNMSEIKVDRPKDMKAGMEYLQKACDGKEHLACYYLSGMFISGVPNTVEKNMKKAFDYSMKACELRNMYACANISQMYAKGDGVEANADLAKKYKDIALDIQEQVKSSQQIQFQQT